MWYVFVDISDLSVMLNASSALVTWWTPILDTRCADD